MEFSWFGTLAEWWCWCGLANPSVCQWGSGLHLQKLWSHRRRGMSRPSWCCSKECSLHLCHLQPCCPLLFFFLIVFFFLMVIILRQLLSFLRVFSCRYRDHNLEGVLPLRNVLRGVGLWLRLGWHIPWCRLSNGLTSSALPGCVASTRHLKFRNRRE
jgi:hypothetical protein